METLIQLVEEGARRFDRRPALLIRPFFRTRTWRYRDLAATVPRAAGVLAQAGLTPGDRVIIWAVNRPEWGVAFLAIVHAGGVAVPLDVRHTVEFGRKVAAQTGARLIVASRQTEAAARQLGLPTVWVPHSYASCSQHAPNEHLLAPVARDALRLMAGLMWDLGESATLPGA